MGMLIFFSNQFLFVKSTDYSTCNGYIPNRGEIEIDDKEDTLFVKHRCKDGKHKKHNDKKFVSFFQKYSCLSKKNSGDDKNSSTYVRIDTNSSVLEQESPINSVNNDSKDEDNIICAQRNDNSESTLNLEIEKEPLLHGSTKEPGDKSESDEKETDFSYINDPHAKSIQKGINQMGGSDFQEVRLEDEAFEDKAECSSTDYSQKFKV